jgi:hypothetical protein
MYIELRPMLDDKYLCCVVHDHRVILARCVRRHFVWAMAHTLIEKATRLLGDWGEDCDDPTGV